MVIICTCTLLVYLTHNINLLYTVPAKVNKVDKDLKVFRLVRLHAMKRVTRDIFRLTRTCWTLTNVKVHKNKFKVTKRRYSSNEHYKYLLLLCNFSAGLRRQIEFTQHSQHRVDKLVIHRLCQCKPYFNTDVSHAKFLNKKYQLWLVWSSQDSLNIQSKKGITHVCNLVNKFLKTRRKLIGIYLLI